MFDFNKIKKTILRSNPLEVFLGKGVLKIYSKFIGQLPFRSATLLKSHFGMGILL